MQLRRTLALGNLLRRIGTLYRRGELEVGTVRHLTLASETQRRNWLTLLEERSAYCPMGVQLKARLFDLATYNDGIVSDLFGDGSYFASVEAFWTAQKVAIEVCAERYREAGWSEVVALPTGEAVHGWEYERTPKA